MTSAPQGQAIRIRGPIFSPAAVAMNSWGRWLRRVIRRFAAPHAATGIRRRARNRTAPFPTVAGRVRADNTGASVHQIHRFRRIPWRAAVSDPEKSKPKTDAPLRAAWALRGMERLLFRYRLCGYACGADSPCAAWLCYFFRTCSDVPKPMILVVARTFRLLLLSISPIKISAVVPPPSRFMASTAPLSSIFSASHVR